MTEPQAETAFAALPPHVRGEAVEEERERDRLDADAHARENDRTIEQVGRELIAQNEAIGRTRSTPEGYASWLDVHLIPEFGPLPIREITRRDVEAFKRALATKRLAPKSIALGLGTLSALMEFAVDREYADVNPVRRVAKPVGDKSADIQFRVARRCRRRSGTPTTPRAPRRSGSSAPSRRPRRTNVSARSPLGTHLSVTALTRLPWVDLRAGRA